MEKDQTKSRITISKIEKYYRLTNDALEIAKNSIAKGKEKQAKEIFLMVESYLSDSQYFKDNNNTYPGFNSTLSLFFIINRSSSSSSS